MAQSESCQLLSVCLVNKFRNDGCLFGSCLCKDGRTACRRLTQWALEIAMRNAETAELQQSMSCRRRVVLWGTFDLGKPRVRMMRKALYDGCDIIEIAGDVWADTRDKSQLSRIKIFLKMVRTFLKWPALIYRYWRAPEHSAVVVGYFGLFDVLAIAIPAKLRGVPVVWDAFLSIYDTVVDDRAMVSKRSMLARSLHMLEGLACRAADVVVLDTRAHANYFEKEYRLPLARTASVMVGCEDAFGALVAQGTGRSGTKPVVLFYGQFIPLHGIDTIIDAVCLPGAERFDWRIIGTGQEAGPVAARIDEKQPQSLQWTEWVAYEELASEISRADICLGVFGTSAKAGRVIPNKVFQILASGKPLVTREGLGMRELLPDGDPAVTLVPAGDAQALLDAVEETWRCIEGQAPIDSSRLTERFAFDAIKRGWTDTIDQAISLKHGGGPV